MTANAKQAARPPPSVSQVSVPESRKLPPLAAHHAAVTPTATADDTSPAAAPTSP